MAVEKSSISEIETAKHFGHLWEDEKRSSVGWNAANGLPTEEVKLCQLAVEASVGLRFAKLMDEGKVY